jgi:transcription antitermination factor NusG
MKENLDKFMAKHGMKAKADNNLIKEEAVIEEYKNKDKVKKLTTTERIERIEKKLGIF